MKKYSLALFFLILANFTKAQKFDVDKNFAYTIYRTERSEPIYHLKEIKALIAKYNRGYGHNNKLPETIYHSLSMKERFTYNMIHLESYSQICSLFLPESDAQNKLFAQLPSFGEFHWSQRQEDFFKSQKDSVIELMTKSIQTSNKVGLNYKLVIEMVDATKTIPFLIKVYNIDKKDHDILTVLMLLMRNNKYPVFINSPLYKSLYGSDQTSYRTSIPFNPINEEAIIKFATDFYDGLPK